jgi:hypothetical protein
MAWLYPFQKAAIVWMCDPQAESSAQRANQAKQAECGRSDEPQAAYERRSDHQ